MRKLFSFWTVALAALFVVGCGDNSVDDTKTPTPSGSTPEITLTAGEILPESISVEVDANMAGTLGYAIVADGFQAPKIDEWFSLNSKDIEKGKTTITIESLNDNTNYTLYAALRSAADSKLSAPKKLTFTTPDDGEDNPIVIENIGVNDVTFTINIPGPILFQCIGKADLEAYGQTIESYFTTEGIAIPDNGPLQVEWVNGQMYGDIEMRLVEDNEYYVIAARCDDADPYPNIVGDIYYKSFRSARAPKSTANMTLELNNITSTSVEITTKPDSEVDSYLVYIREKALIDQVVSYGESHLVEAMKEAVYDSSFGKIWELAGPNTDVWDGLSPEVAYSICVLIFDKTGKEALFIDSFTTSSASSDAPTVEMSITEPVDNPHNTLALNILSYQAAKCKVVFRPTADVEEKRKEGMSDSQIVNSLGIELSQVDIDAISNSGLSIKMEDLWPEVEYTAIVSVRNVEYTETIKTASYTTAKQPAAPCVESELFTSLLGKWKMTYSLIQENEVTATVSDIVQIKQGVDAKTIEDYRNQNQLVILGFPFNVTAQGQYNKIPVVTPAELLEARPNYYSHGHNLIYRDYGPKIFLQISEGDKLSVPTSKGCYLYNWSEEGFLSFYGCDYNNLMTAPATFPVEVSNDGNTITISGIQSGEEFGFGLYYPSVFLNDSKMKTCATSDIVLERVQ